jgi:hypothetical protein
MFSQPVDQLTFEIQFCRGKPYIQRGVYYADDADGSPQGSSHRNNPTLEESIEMLKAFFKQLEEQQ